MKLEADYKRWMADSVKEAGGYARRIEDQYAVGTLDMVFVFNGITVFAEVKRYRSNTFAPSPRQLIEMRRIRAAGGKSILIGCAPDAVSFVGAVEKAQRFDGKVVHYPSKWMTFYNMLKHYMENYYE